MPPAKTVAQSVREEVDRHRHKLLKLEESTIRIAVAHKCPNPGLIRLALLRIGMRSGAVVQL